MASTDQPTRTRITAQLRALRFDAGSLSLNLAATVGRRGATEIERLSGPDRLREWCAGVGVELRAADQTPEFVATLHELRAAVYDAVTATLHGHRPTKAAVLNHAAQVGVPAPRLTSTGIVRPTLTGPELRSLIARDLLAVLAEPTWLRECASDVCQMVYVDNPGGRPRKWCSMQRCGNQAKAAQHRRKVASVPAESWRE